MKSRVNHSIHRLLYHIAKANAEVKGKPFASRRPTQQKEPETPSVKDFQSLRSAVQSLKQDVSTLLKEQSFHDSYDRQIVEATHQEHDRLNTLDRKEHELETEYHSHDEMLQTAAKRLENLSIQVRDLQNSATQEMHERKKRKETTQILQQQKTQQQKDTAHNEISMKHLHHLKEIMYVEDKLRELERYYNDMQHSGYPEERLQPVEERIHRFKQRIKELKEKNKIFQ